MDTVDQIKQKISIEDLVAEYVPLKKAGRNYKAVCPFHTEDTPSFMVSPELQIYKCFGCSEGGDIFNFVQKIEGIEFPQALELLADKAGIKLVKKRVDPQKKQRNALFEVNYVASEFYHYLLTKHKVGKEALNYVTKTRGLKLKIIKEYKIGYSPTTWDALFKVLSKKKFSARDMIAAGLVMPKKSGVGYIDKFRGRVMFPISDISGRVVGFTARALSDESPKYINTNETLVYNKSGLLFGLDKAKIEVKKHGAVLVEGPLDVISASTVGVSNAVAPLGTALTIGQLKVLSRYTKDITLCFDNDSAGREAIIRALHLAEQDKFNVSVALIPDKYKDLDELVQNEPDKVNKVLNESVPAYEFFLIAALKKHKAHSSIGKKKIIEDLAPIYGNIKNPVEYDHYVKRLSEAIDTAEQAVREALQGGKFSKAAFDRVESGKKTSTKYFLSKKSPQEYVLALLLKAPLDTSQTLLYKLGQKDFTDSRLANIFINLKKYLLGRKRKLNIKSFSNKFEDEDKKLVMDMYLWDLGVLNEDERYLLRELDSTFDRIKKDTIKRELKEISAKIKEAELKKEDEELEELSKKFSELSEKLV